MTKAADSLFIRACFGEPVPRPPIWMMRQAGRYLPQYRAVREQVSFLELCRSPERVCEVTLQPIEEFGFDAAILFCDILIPLQAMGLDLSFPKGGPKISNPVRQKSDIDRLSISKPEVVMPFVMDSVSLLKKRLPQDTPLIGFCGAPFTLLTYAVEGQGSKSYPHTKQLLFGKSDVAETMLGLLAENCADYLEAQVKAGADAVQIFDSWAGILGPVDFRRFALRFAKQVIQRLRDSDTWQRRRVPIIYFVNGCAPYLEDYGQSGADVLGIDWRVDIPRARSVMGNKVSVQGNLDPAALFLPDAELRMRVQEILKSNADMPGYIFNLGHGVMPQTDPEKVRLMVNTVKQWRSNDSSNHS